MFAAHFDREIGIQAHCIAFYLPKSGLSQWVLSFSVR